MLEMLRKDGWTLARRPQAGWFEAMSRYLVVIEEAESGFSAFSPDLPGCVATGSSRPEVERNMREAIALHVDGLRLEGYEVPRPRTFYSYVDV